MFHNICSQFPTNTTYFFGCKTICYNGHTLDGMSQIPMSISKHTKNSKSYESHWLGSVISGGGSLELWHFLNNSENWVRQKRHKIQNFSGCINCLFIEQGLFSSIVLSSAAFRLPRLFNTLSGFSPFTSGCGILPVHITLTPSTAPFFSRDFFLPPLQELLPAMHALSLAGKDLPSHLPSVLAVLLDAAD